MKSGNVLMVSVERSPFKHAVRLPHGESRIGRAGHNDIILNDGYISREHAVLRVDDRGIQLRTYETKTSVELDGAPVSAGQVAVAPGNTLRIGEYQLTFEAESLTADLPMTQSLDLPRTASLGKPETYFDHDLQQHVISWRGTERPEQIFDTGADALEAAFDMEQIEPADVVAELRCVGECWECALSVSAPTNPRDSIGLLRKAARNVVISGEDCLSATIETPFLRLFASATNKCNDAMVLVAVRPDALGYLKMPPLGDWLRSHHSPEVVEDLFTKMINNQG